MIVSELIAQLQALPADLPVRCHDSEWGSWTLRKGAVLAIAGEPTNDWGAAWCQELDGTEWRDEDEQYTDCVLIT